MVNPVIIIICAVSIKIICFSDDTKIKALENGKEVVKKISDTKVDDMVLVHNGTEKKYARVMRNDKVEGNIEFYMDLTKFSKNILLRIFFEVYLEIILRIYSELSSNILRIILPIFFEYSSKCSPKIQLNFLKISDIEYSE